MTSITRHFIDWQQPALVAAADYLVGRYRQNDTIALGNLVLVLPGRRAGRRLLEILLDRVEIEGCSFVPSAMVTAGNLAELFYEPQRPFASDLAQRLTWIRALKETDRAQLEQVFPQLPTEDASDQWLLLGSTLWQLHRRLAADALDFADVARMGSDVEGFSETKRWQTLRRIQEVYLGILDELHLWDIQTARLYAIDGHECHADKEIVLVATVDMNRALRQMLDQVADRVTALVYAPEDWSDRFDEYGCLVPEAWQGVTLGLEDEQIRVAEDAADQAETVMRRLAEFEGRYRADEITIGVPDERLVPHIQRELKEFNVPARWLVGKTLPETGPCRLLAAVRDFLVHERTGHWAELVRHPDVGVWLKEKSVPDEWLTQLDVYYNDHLQPRLGVDWLGRESDRDQVEAAYALVRSLLSDLSGTDRRNLDAWTEPIMTVVSTVYGWRDLDRTKPADAITIGACEALAACLASLDRLPPRIMTPVTASEAIDLVLEQLSDKTLPSAPDPEAVEILGWLELPLDDAPALIVTSFNEGYVPQSNTGDLFLPDGLCHRLGLEDNLKRFARDAYALHVLGQTRKDLLLVVSRLNTEGHPLAPSRLLFAAEQKTIARRILTLCKPISPGGQRFVGGNKFSSSRERSDFDVPRPEALENPVESMRVTAFRGYLVCPYRYYLDHVLGLGSLDDSAEELDALAFGTLLHDVLNGFGKSDLKHSTDSDQIEQFLREELERFAQIKFGNDRLAPVSIQLHQMRGRLSAFAQWQAEWADKGWRIVHSEVPPRGSPDAQLDVDGKPMGLRGRIDRIDTNEDGQWIIFDYKSSSAPDTPEKKHRKRGDWVDLQLPLYRHIAATLGVTGDVRLGYIVLPKDTGKVGALVAEWTDADLQEADEVAREVVRCIRREKFWPPADNPEFAGDYAPICMEDVFEPPRYKTQVGDAEKGAT